MTNANTCAAVKATAKNAKNTSPEKVSVERALTVTQDIMRLNHAAGIGAWAMNVDGGVAIVLDGVYFCAACKNLSLGASCQKCEVPET